MCKNRLEKHPILDIERGEKITILWEGQPLPAFTNESVASALIANNIHTFRYHPKSGSAQGIFCANGQCAQCMVLIDKKPEKSCMVKARNGMQIAPLYGHPSLIEPNNFPSTKKIKELEIEALIIGGGPAGMSAAIELGEKGINSILIDDKHILGGKLILQTHRFFGSTKDVYASQRGIQIADILRNKIAQLDSVKVWTNSTALAVFSDQSVGVLKNNDEYILLKPKTLLNAAGAREKFLHFPGNSLPGVMGAGAFQTLLNRDFVLPAKSLFILGGGNVGLIAGYHTLQAGIHVVGLAEMLPECGGYQVHVDKLKRLGVHIHTSHSVLYASGKNHVESITIAKVDDKYECIDGTEKTYPCDCILVAVGLDKVDEFHLKAKAFQIKSFSAGDAENIAEASAAMISGKIKAKEIINVLRGTSGSIPLEWKITKKIMESRPGRVYQEIQPNKKTGVYPILHCSQEIPCDPCASLCPLHLIKIDEVDIRKIPFFEIDEKKCTGCMQCLIGCPGLAITLVDYRENPDNPIVSIPFELDAKLVEIGQTTQTVDTKGFSLGEFQIVDINQNKNNNKTSIIKIRTRAEVAEKISGISTIKFNTYNNDLPIFPKINSDDIVCLCEHVTAGEITHLINKGITDMNALKTISRAGMGACGGKTCEKIIFQLMVQNGIPIDDITHFSKRPLFVEVPIINLAGKMTNSSE